MITDCAWDSKKMRTEVHDWVHKLADHCRAVCVSLHVFFFVNLHRVIRIKQHVVRTFTGSGPHAAQLFSTFLKMSYFPLFDHLLQVWDYMMLTEQFAESSPLLREQVQPFLGFDLLSFQFFLRRLHEVHAKGNTFLWRYTFNLKRLELSAGVAGDMPSCL